MCLHLQSSFLYLCNCFSSQKHPHLSGNLKAQPCVGFALSFLFYASFLVFEENRSLQLINIYFTVPYHQHWTIQQCNNFILTPVCW